MCRFGRVCLGLQDAGPVPFRGNVRPVIRVRGGDSGRARAGVCLVPSLRCLWEDPQALPYRRGAADLMSRVLGLAQKQRWVRGNGIAVTRLFFPQDGFC